MVGPPQICETKLTFCNQTSIIPARCWYTPRKAHSPQRLNVPTKPNSPINVLEDFPLLGPFTFWSIHLIDICRELIWVLIRFYLFYENMHIVRGKIDNCWFYCFLIGKRNVDWMQEFETFSIYCEFPRRGMRFYLRKSRILKAIAYILIVILVASSKLYAHMHGIMHI